MGRSATGGHGSKVNGVGSGNKHDNNIVKNRQGKVVSSTDDRSYL